MHTPTPMSDCDCEQGCGKTTTIKICDCDCDCDCECCVEQLYSQIEADPNLLQKNETKFQFVHTLLHEAAAAGRVSLAVEIMNLRPSLATKLNPEGLSPLHVAIQKEKADVALVLVKLDKRLVQIKGRGGFTPLHYAAEMKPDDEGFQTEVLAVMLTECPEAMGVLNNRLQSAVHVALENGNLRAAELLVNWEVIMAKESDLSINDSRGNTTLHVAARYCDNKELLTLLTKLVKVNKVNKYGETALGIAVQHRNGNAIDMLNKAGATKRMSKRGQDESLQRKESTTVRYLRANHAHNWAEMLTRAYYFIAKEMTMDMRNTILVVAVLIATTTYQGVLQPPGGVYSAEGNSNATNRLGLAFRARRLGDRNRTHPPGRMVMGTTKYSYFMPTNTLAFISSTLIIIYALPDRAFVVILQACLIFMCVSYLLALNFISYYNGFSQALDLVCGCILGIAFFTKIGYYLVKAYYNDDEWLLRRLGVMISNRKARFFGTAMKDEDSEADKKDGDAMTFLTRARKQYKLISKRDVPLKSTQILYS